MLASLGEKLDVIQIIMRKYGLVGMLRLIWTDVLYDFRNEVDTFAPVSRDKLFTGDRRALQNRYVPSTFSLAEATIGQARTLLGPDASRAGFIDYGSGKAKVLIAAARHDFSRIFGIEFDPGLHEIALRNIARLGLQGRVEVACGDATQFSPLPTDRVLYFFNPFEGEILEAVLRNIKSVEPAGKRIIICVNPVCDAIFCKNFEKLREEILPGAGGGRYAIYTD